MRKWLALLLTAMLLMSVLPAAAAEAQPGIYRLVMRSESGVTWLGMAALVDQSGASLLTSADAIPDDAKLYAVGQDGTIAVTSVTVDDASGVARLVLARASTLAPLTLSAAEPVTYTALRQDGQLVSGETGSTMRDIYRDTEAMSAELCEGVLPGSMLFDADGYLTGMVIAAANEGFARYVCYSSETLYQRLMAMTYVIRQPADDSAASEDEAVVTEVTAVDTQALLTMNENGRLVVDLSAMEVDADTQLLVCYAVSGNPYYAIAQTDENHQAVLSVLPGTEYWLWFVREDDSDAVIDLGNISMTYQVPEADSYADHGFTPVSSWVGVADESGLDGDSIVAEAADSVTIAQLMGGKYLYLCVASTYTADDTMPLSLPGMLAVFGPDGSSFTVDSTYTFSSEYLPTDAWSTDITAQVAAVYGQLGAGEGTYTVRYYIAGRPAAECSFELTAGETAGAVSPEEPAEADAEEAAEAPAVSGEDEEPAAAEDAESARPTATLQGDGTVLVELAGLPEGHWYLYLSDQESPYYTLFDMGSDRSLQLTLVPGHNYTLWLGQGDDEAP